MPVNHCISKMFEFGKAVLTARTVHNSPMPQKRGHSFLVKVIGRLMRTQKLGTLLAVSTLAMALAACESVGTPTLSGQSTVPTTTTTTTGSSGVGTATNPAPTGSTSLSTAVAPTTLTPAVLGTPTTASPTLGGLTGPTAFNSASASQRYTNSGGGEIYEGNQPITINDGFVITRDPRDATYIVVIKGQNSIAANTRYQDPAHRTNYAGAASDFARLSAQPSVDYDLSALIPNIANTEYYTSGSLSADTPVTVRKTLLFTERVGTAASSTQYVSWAAYWQYDANAEALKRVQTLQRSSAIFGFNTLAQNVPTTGNATYNGGFYADGIDGNQFYTLAGTSTFGVNFVTNKGTFGLNGSFVSAGPNDPSVAPRLGQTFKAGGEFTLIRPETAGSATSTTAPIGVFSGKVTSLALGGTTYEYLPNETKLLSFQGSSVEGGFFGPRAEEIGATFRIVGGTPNQRLDITGAATGRKN
jgi:hypothetical protein